jgi:hypothetical protein
MDSNHLQEYRERGEFLKPSVVKRKQKKGCNKKTEMVSR